jgi:hypothetical protein
LSPNKKTHADSCRVDQSGFDRQQQLAGNRVAKNNTLGLMVRADAQALPLTGSDPLGAC